MRRYPANSPRAMARVVALTLLADGTVSRGELLSLMRLDVYERLKLDPLEMQDVLEDLARDLFESGAPTWDCSGGLEPLLVSCVLQDVSDPALRAAILELCREVAGADSDLAAGEIALLAQASSQWRLAAGVSAQDTEAS